MDLRSEVRKLPYIQEIDKWSSNRRALVNHILNENIGNFINWSTIQATMFTGDGVIVKSAWDEIMRSNRPVRYRIAMRENWLGNPPPSEVNIDTSPNMIRMAYYACQMEWYLKFKYEEIESIFEFGGGYGALAWIIRNLWFTGDYYLYDFPEYLLLQQFYLEANGIKADYEHELKPRDVDLFVAISSLSEAPIDTREKIFENINFKKCFIEFQPIWDGIDNYEYFITYAKMTLPKWKILGSKLSSHYYLIGEK